MVFLASAAGHRHQRAGNVIFLVNSRQEEFQLETTISVDIARGWR